MAYKIVDTVAIQKAIAKKQATIDKNSRKMKTNPKRIAVGWTAKSGEYKEQSRKPENDTAFKEVILDFRGVKDRKGEKEFRDSYKTKVMDVARIHEYGLGGHTEKAMLRKTKAEHAKEWQKFVDEEVAYARRNKQPIDIDKIAEDVGQLAKHQLEAYVRRIELVDTGRLANSVVVEYKRRR